MVRHGSLWFGINLSSEEWKEIKTELANRVDFDPYEPDWSEKKR